MADKTKSQCIIESMSLGLGQVIQFAIYYFGRNTESIKNQTLRDRIEI